MIKKFLTLIVIIILSFALFTGCANNSNDNTTDTTDKYEFYEFVYFYEIERAYRIRKWEELKDTNQLKITLEDGTVLLVHSSSCALIKGEVHFPIKR